MTACVASCVTPRRHTTTCPDQDACPGCLPAPAAHGIHVCAWHERELRRALRDIPGLWAEIGDPRGTRPSSGNRGANGTRLPLSDAKTAARDLIRRTLTVWCVTLRDDYAVTVPDERAVIAGTRALIVREQQLTDDATTPTDRWTHTRTAQALREQREAGADLIAAMCEHIDRQLTRILAHPDHADQITTDLLGATHDEAGITTHGAYGAARQHAGTPRRTGITVACPDCAGPVHIDPDNDWHACPDCGEGGVIAWWRTQLAPDTNHAMTADGVCAWIRIHHRIRLTPDTLRQWVHRGHITPTPGPGPGRYDPVQVAAHALATQR